jgi:ferredoxin--NADP+ reductase
MDKATPRRVAVVGAGPSGLFAAQALVNQDRVPVTVDLYERLPAPYGLLRYGVAPDHTSIKSVANALAKVFESPGIRLCGAVEFGVDVTAAELVSGYDAVVYAVGAALDMSMGVPGEDLPGSRAAREFVAWYSGHPDAPAQDLSGVRSAAVVGVGNVAVDVARILAKRPDQLDVTDMPLGVLAELRRHEVRDVYLIGRRGPQHAAFTTKELRELLELEDVQVVIDPALLAGIDVTGLDRRAKANVEAMAHAPARQAPDPRCRLHLLFWQRPVRLDGDGAVESLTLEQTYLDADGRVQGTGQTQTIPVDLVLRSIGYKGAEQPGLPFDARRGVVPNQEGRVCDADGAVRPGEYVVGWIKRGPTGVIGTNKSDAAQTVKHVVEDLAAQDRPRELIDLHALLAARGATPTTFQDWLAIDAAEVALGAENARERTKVDTWEGLMSACGRPSRR